MTPKPQTRPGRRPGDNRTQDVILSAARELFSRDGYAGASLRAIAAAADVDPGMIRHFFGSKDGLFEAALALPDGYSAALTAAIDGAPDGIGERITRAYLSLWENPETAAPVLAMVRTALASERAAERSRDLVTSRLITHAIPALSADRPALRASLAGAHLTGAAFVRHVLRIEPLADLSFEEVVRLIAPAIQRYLSEPL
ncbi:TetR/AcrR family transcriptional regulator [Microbacterium sp. NPDC055357]